MTINSPSTFIPPALGNTQARALIDHSGQVIKPASGKLHLKDPDGWDQTDGQNNYHCTVLGTPKYGSLIIDPYGNWTYTPTPGVVPQNPAETTESILIRVVDKAGFASSHFIHPTITAPSEAVKGTDKITHKEGDLWSGDLDVFDINGISNPNFTVFSGHYSGEFKIDAQTGKFTYSGPTAGVSGNEHVMIKVTDNIGMVSTVCIDLTTPLSFV